MDQSHPLAHLPRQVEIILTQPPQTRDTLGTYSSTSTGVPNNTVYCIDGGMAEFAVWKRFLPLVTQTLLVVALAR